MNEESNVEQKRPRGTGCIYQREGSSNWWIHTIATVKSIVKAQAQQSGAKLSALLQQKLAKLANHTFIDPKVRAQRQ